MKPGYLRIALSLSAVAAGLAALSYLPASIGGSPPLSVTSGAHGAWTDEPGVTHDLATFDTLDFDVFTNQKWDRLKESHAADIVVTWPDGHETHGLAQHIKDLEYMFSFAPDTRIKVHPIKLGVGEWTSVVGEMEGTFTKPMVLPDGKVIAPTNRPYKITMVTIGHWTKAGVMDHEWLIWDNDSFNRQIGLSK